MEGTGTYVPKTQGILEKEGQLEQIGVIHARNFQPQITYNKVLYLGTNLCVLKQFDVSFSSTE